MHASSNHSVRDGVGKGFHLGSVHAAGPITIKSQISVSVGARKATFVAGVRSQGGCVVHHTSGLSGRSRVVTTGMSRTVLVIAIGCPVAAAIFVSHFLTATRTCHIPIGLIFGGVSHCRNNSQRLLSSLIALCAAVNCPYSVLYTHARRNLSILERSLGKEVALLSNRSNIKGSAVVGGLVPNIGLHANSVSRCRGGKVRAAAFSRVVPLSSNNCLVSAPNVGNFNAVRVRNTRVTRCFPRVFGFSTSYGFGGYSRHRRPNYTILHTMRRRCVDRSQCGDCLDVLSSGRRDGCERRC